MTRERKPSQALVRLTPTLAGEIVRRLEADRTASKEAVVAGVLLESKRFETIDLWELQQDAAVSYWVLLLTGVNQPREMEIAQELLVWQAFFSKESAPAVTLRAE